MRDFYAQPHLTDPVLQPESVLAVARSHASNAREVKVVDESGGEARAYAIDDGLILKVQRPHKLRPRTSLRKEAFFLGRLEAESDVSVPRVVGYGDVDGREYLLISRMPGVAVRTTNLDGDARVRALMDLGATLRRVHSIDQAPIDASRQFPGDRSPVDIRWRLGTMLEEAATAVAERGRPWTHRLSPLEIVHRVMSGLPEPNGWVALHSNPGPEHVFVDPASGAFSGVIDFGDSYVSHPALDLRRWYWPADREAILMGYERDGDVGDVFRAVWHACMVWADLNAIAAGHEAADASAARLDTAVFA